MLRAGDPVRAQKKISGFGFFAAAAGNGGGKAVRPRGMKGSFRSPLRRNGRKSREIRFRRKFRASGASSCYVHVKEKPDDFRLIVLGGKYDSRFAFVVHHVRFRSRFKEKLRGFRSAVSGGKAQSRFALLVLRFRVRARFKERFHSFRFAVCGGFDQFSFRF